MLCSGCAAHVRVRRGCFVWGWARVSRVRAHGLLGCAPCRAGSAPPKLGSTAACGFCVLRKAPPRKSRHASGPRPAGTMQSGRAQALPSKSRAISRAALPPRSKSRWPPGATPRSLAPVAALCLTPAPPLPAASSARVQAHSAASLPELPPPRRRRSSSQLKARSARSHSEAPRCPAASRDLTREPPQWLPPRSSTTGSRPTCTY